MNRLFSRDVAIEGTRSTETESSGGVPTIHLGGDGKTLKPEGRKILGAHHAAQR